MSEVSKNLIIGVSGPSSSGKTTLARLLRDIFNTATEDDDLSILLFILHEDDFYKNDKDIPSIKVTSPEHGTRDVQDWDCIDALDLPLFTSTLEHITQHGSPPPSMFSKEDKNTVGPNNIPSSTIEDLKSSTRSRLADLTRTHTQNTSPQPLHINICLLEGFLLFPPPPSHLQPGSQTQADQWTFPHTSHSIIQLHSLSQSHLNLRLFLPTTKEKCIFRRANRAGYVTLEGFWADPPGYVEDVVWPNYVRYHAWMYRGSKQQGVLGEADGGGGRGQEGNGSGEDETLEEIDEERVREEGVKVLPGNGEWGMERVLEWGVQRVWDAIGEVL